MSSSPLRAQGAHPAAAAGSRQAAPSPAAGKSPPASRYARHLALHELGKIEPRVHSAAVVVVGAGPIAQACVLYLAAAGVERIVIVDGAPVDAPDLPRVFGIPEAALGSSRAEALAQAARRTNATVQVSVVAERPGQASLSRAFAGAACAVDCGGAGEGAAARLAVADIAWSRGVPLVHACAARFTASLTTLVPGPPAEGADPSPCLRCLYPREAPRELQLNPDRDGTFGPAAGVAGTLAAAEALKLVMYADQPSRVLDYTLLGRLKLVNCLDMTSRTVAYSRRPGCPCCGRK